MTFVCIKTHKLKHTCPPSGVSRYSSQASVTYNE